MTDKKIKGEFVNEVLSDPDYEGTILRHLFEINVNSKDNIKNHDLYNIICSLSFEKLEILLRSFDLNLPKINAMIDIFGNYSSKDISEVASIFGYSTNNEFLEMLLEDIKVILENLRRLYESENNNNWILFENIFVILQKYLTNDDNLNNLNEILYINLNLGIFIDDDNDFDSNFNTRYIGKMSQPNLKKVGLISISDNTESFTLTSFLNQEEKWIVSKRDLYSGIKIKKYFPFDTKEIIIRFLKDLPIEFVYLNKILNIKPTINSYSNYNYKYDKPETYGKIDITEFENNISSFFNTSLTPPLRFFFVDEKSTKSSRPSSPPPVKRATSPLPNLDAKNIFPESSSNLHSISYILHKKEIYEIFKLILGIKIKHHDFLKKIINTNYKSTEKGYKICFKSYYDLIDEYIKYTKTTIRVPALTKTSEQRKFLSIRGVIDRAANLVLILKGMLVSVGYKFLTKLIFLYIKIKEKVNIGVFTKEVEKLTVETLNFKILNELISFLLNKDNLDHLANLIDSSQNVPDSGKKKKTQVIKQAVIGDICLDYISNLHYILPIQENLFNLSLKTDYFKDKFYDYITKCETNMVKYFQYNKIKIELMKQLITEQDLSILSDGIGFALMYLIFKRDPKSHQEITELYENYITRGIANETINTMNTFLENELIKDRFTIPEIQSNIIESLTSLSKGIHHNALQSEGSYADGVKSSIKGLPITPLNGKLINFIRSNRYLSATAVLKSIIIGKKVKDKCVIVGSKAIDTAYNYISSYFNPTNEGGGKRTRKYRKHHTRKAKRNSYCKNKSHKRKNKRKNKKTKQS